MDDDDDTTRPPNGKPHTTVPGGEIGAKFRALEAEDIIIRGYVDEVKGEIMGQIAASEERLSEKLDRVIDAHNASPVKRAFDVLEKLASPASGVVLLLNVLVVLLWLTGRDFEGYGYKIADLARPAAQANADSDADRPVNGGE